MNRSKASGKGRRERFSFQRLLLAILGGVIIEYLWDPNRGRGRRAVARDQMRSAVRHGMRRVSRQARYLGGEVYGSIEESAHFHEPDNPYPDDATLRDRVESELFRDWAVPKGEISINVALGIVELRGQVNEAGKIETIEQKVRGIEGVHTIHNYLHTPGTPAPNKARVLAIS